MSFRRKADLDNDIWEDVSANSSILKDSKPSEPPLDTLSSQAASSTASLDSNPSSSPITETTRLESEQESLSRRRFSGSGDGGGILSCDDLGSEQSVEVLRERLTSLYEVNQQLSKRLEEESEKANALESGRAELLSKVANLERKLAAVVKERESLKRTSKNADAELLKEKDAQIEQILEEGEKLSKKILEKEQYIKKLRSRIQDVEKDKESQRSRVQELEQRIQKLSAQYAALENSESSLRTALNEKEQKLKENAASVDKLKETEASLSSITEQLEEWKRKYQQDLENKEKEWRQQTESLLNSVAMEASRKQKSLEQEVELLRSRVDEVMATTASKEDEWKHQLERYRKKCHDLEEQLASYTLSPPSMDQLQTSEMEQLQKYYTQLLQQSKVVEDSLYEKVKLANSEKSRMEAEYNSLKEEISKLSEEKKAMEDQWKGEMGRVQELSAEREKLLAELENTRQELVSSRENFEDLIQRYRSEINDLKSSLYTERQWKRSQKFNNVSFVNSSVQTIDISLDEQTPGVVERDDYHKVVDEASIRSRSDTAVGELERLTLDAYSFERLKFLVRQLAGDVEMLLGARKHLETEHQHAMEQLNRYKEEKELYVEQRLRLNAMQQELEELRIRYNATLEILGERDERVQELESDVEDLKTAYRDQVNYLLSKLNAQE